jgi:hypothetical protein
VIVRAEVELAEDEVMEALVVEVEEDDLDAMEYVGAVGAL